MLHVFVVGEIGGAEEVLLNIVRHSERTDINHYAVLVSDNEGPLGTGLTDLGVPWQRISRGRMRNPLALYRACHGIRRVIREFNITAVLTNAPQGFLYARCAALGLALPTTLYYMTVPKPRFWSNSVLEILTALARPDAIFTASGEICRILTRWGLGNVQTVHHGTALKPPRLAEVAEVQRILNQHGVSQADLIILLPGRLQTWKGQHVLIEAMPEVLRKFPTAHAVLLGGSLFGLEANYEDNLRNQILDLSLEEHVHIVGHQPIRGWLDRAAVVVHCSILADPFPNVCIEAMAACRPVITNRLSGTREIISSGLDGFVVEANDPNALANTIIEIFESPTNATRVAEQGYQKYLATCTPTKMVQPIEATLVSIVGNSA